MSLNPNQVVVQLGLNLDQINLVITGLAKLPYEQVADLVTIVRASALNTLANAEAQAKAEEAAKTAAIEVLPPQLTTE